MGRDDDQEVRNLQQPLPRGTWVQTERLAHEAMAQLIAKAPRAAQLLHVLIANMDKSNALIASQATLAKMTNVSMATTKRALQVLTEQAWIQTIRLGGERGGALAYVVNSRVAWADSRDNLRFARFNARVLVSSEDQPDLGYAPLQNMPVVSASETQFPEGDGLGSPFQEPIGGLYPAVAPVDADVTEPDR